MLFFNLNNGLILILSIASILSLSFFIERYFQLRFFIRTHLLFLNDYSLLKEVPSFNKENYPFYAIFFKIISSKNSLHEKRILLKQYINIYQNAFEFRIEIIGLISNLSPIIGILGTILGIMKGSQSLNSQNLNFLNEGFWEALLTTALGLTISIISSIFYFYLKSKTDLFIGTLLKDLYKKLDKT